MAKELGQIHVVNSTFPVSAAAQKFNIDLPGELTSQLQRMIRAGTYHKCVGIDMTLDTQGTLGGGQISGFIRYYAPTRGRCAAYRGAFQTMAELMKSQGLVMRENPMYDFKMPLNDDTTVNLFANQATFKGNTFPLSLNSSVASNSVFGVHNENVQPKYTGTAGDLFNGGFNTLLQDPATGTDFVINYTVPFTGDPDFASTEYEEIPFMVAWSPDEGGAVNQNRLTPVSFNWRPDPALFLAIMCGQLQVVVEEINVDSGASTLNLQIATMVSGWKSIMGSPDKKRKKLTVTRKMPVNKHSFPKGR